MREYWYFLPLIGVIFILMAFQISDYTIEDYSEIPNKITDLSKISNIEVNGLNISIKFDPKSSELFYSKKIQLKIRNDSLFLEGTKLEKNLEIVIGTKKRLKNVIIDGLNININGVLYSELLEINGTNIVFSNDFFFNGNNIKIDGTNVVLKGYIKSNLLSSDGISNNLDIEIEKVKDINLDGINIHANIKYLDIWKDTRNINIDGISTNITVYIKKENSGELLSNKTIKIINY
ncbi:hypothetical protein JCM30566_02700 [Marinitoga arctica]